MMTLKVEYSYYENSPSLIVKGKDFLDAFKNQKTIELLRFSIDSFYCFIQIISPFEGAVNDAVKTCLANGDSVIYTFEEEYHYGNVYRYAKVLVRKTDTIIPVLFYDKTINDYRINKLIDN